MIPLFHGKAERRFLKGIGAKKEKMNYLQLEKGESIKKPEIIGIFDIDKVGTASATKELFKRKEDEKGVVSLSNDLPKSFLLCDGEFTDSIYISGLSCESILKRLESEKGIGLLWKK